MSDSGEMLLVVPLSFDDSARETMNRTDLKVNRPDPSQRSTTLLLLVRRAVDLHSNRNNPSKDTHFASFLELRLAPLLHLITRSAQ
jgi:hypothetical protein